jgi:hypothetical protein
MYVCMYVCTAVVIRIHVIDTYVCIYVCMHVGIYIKTTPAVHLIHTCFVCVSYHNPPPPGPKGMGDERESVVYWYLIQ